MAALDGAVALAQVDDVPVTVRQDLEFDVVRPLDVFLDEDAAVAESGLRFARRGVHVDAQLLVGPDDAQPAPASAGAGLDHHRVADAFRERDSVLRARHALLGARHDRHAGLLRQVARLDLVAHQMDGLRGRPDEGDAGRLAQMGEAGVFREEAVARMDRVRSDAAGQVHDLLAVQEAFHGAGADHVGLVGLFDVDAGGIGIGINGGGRDIQFAAGANDAHRNFTAVGDQNFLEHRRLSPV